MCGTMNDQGGQSCNYCRYLFENFDSPAAISTDRVEVPVPAAAPKDAVPLPFLDQNQSTSSHSSELSSGSPLFVVKKSILASIVPGIAYLFFIIAVSSYSAFSLLSLLLIAVLLAASIVPVLFSPRKFEFFDHSLKIHKTIGGDSEFQYSDLTMYDSPMRRRS